MKTTVEKAQKELDFFMDTLWRAYRPLPGATPAELSRLEAHLAKMREKKIRDLEAAYSLTPGSLTGAS